jgi:hypothetical protein
VGQQRVEQWASKEQRSHGLLRQAQLDREVSGVSFGRDGPTVTHLLFADDSVVFLEASTGNLEALKGILQRYEAYSGQRVNL